jgi:putative Holliday junction resolvase
VSESEPAGRLLALDLGEARIGLALSDLLGLTAQPLPALQRVGPRKDLQKLGALVREHQVATVVVGLPLKLSGEEGPQAVAAREFAARLERHVGRARVVMWDERLTTVQAEREMIRGDVRRRKRRQHVDSMAAALILQSYLEARGAAAQGLDA